MLSTDLTYKKGNRIENSTETTTNTCDQLLMAQFPYHWYSHLWSTLNKHYKASRIFALSQGVTKLFDTPANVVLLGRDTPILDCALQEFVSQCQRLGVPYQELTAPWALSRCSDTEEHRREMKMGGEWTYRNKVSGRGRKTTTTKHTKNPNQSNFEK